jgi:hypothetical protein
LKNLGKNGNESLGLFVDEVYVEAHARRQGGDAATCRGEVAALPGAMKRRFFFVVFPSLDSCRVSFIGLLHISRTSFSDGVGLWYRRAVSWEGSAHGAG